MLLYSQKTHSTNNNITGDIIAAKILNKSDDSKDANIDVEKGIDVADAAKIQMYVFTNLDSLFVFVFYMYKCQYSNIFRK